MPGFPQGSRFPVVSVFYSADYRGMKYLTTCLIKDCAKFLCANSTNFMYLSTYKITKRRTWLEYIEMTWILRLINDLVAMLLCHHVKVANLCFVFASWVSCHRLNACFWSDTTTLFLYLHKHSVDYNSVWYSNGKNTFCLVNLDFCTPSY